MKKSKTIVFFCFLIVNSCNANNDSESIADAIEVSFNRFFIIKQGNKNISVIFNKLINKGEGGFNYLCFWKHKANKGWIKENIRKYEGQLYEEYNRINNDHGGYTIVGDTGKLFIQCNGFDIEWSADYWIYLNTPNGKIKIAITDKTELKNIDFDDINLIWHGSNQPEVKNEYIFSK